MSGPVFDVDAFERAQARQELHMPRIRAAVAVMRDRAASAGFGQFIDGNDGFCALRDSLKIIASAATHGDGFWAHVSASYPNALPSWVIMKRVKRDVLGRAAKAIMVLPPESEHINIHSFVHHLWCRLDGDSLPDFTEGTGSI